MSGGCHMFEVIYGRKFTEEELASQPVRIICMESLVHDNQLEQDHINKKEQENKGKGGGLVLGTGDAYKKLYEWKHPTESNAIVTLLTSEEYYSQVAKSANHNSNVSGKNPNGAGGKGTDTAKLLK